MGHVPELGLGAVVRGVAGRVERGGAELPTFVHCVELEIERRLAVWAQQSWLRELHHALQCLETRVGGLRSEEHTSELQSPCNLVCRLLLEKKKTTHEVRMQGRMTTSHTTHMAR